MLDVHNVAVGYGQRLVVTDASFGVPRGYCRGLFGDNGAGKTTLFRALVGQLPLARGTISLLDHEGTRRVDLSQMTLSGRARAGIGYLPQRPALLWELDARQNLEVALASPAARAADAWAPRRSASLVDEALERVGLRAAALTPASHLSGGQVKRLSIARLLVLRSRVWLCDEPLSGLDAEGVATHVKILEEARESGVAMVLTEHRSELLRRLADSLLVVEDGVVLPDKIGRDLSLDAIEL